MKYRKLEVMHLRYLFLYNITPKNLAYVNELSHSFSESGKLEWLNWCFWLRIHHSSAVKVFAWSAVSIEGSTGRESSSKLTHMAVGSYQIYAPPCDCWLAYGSCWILAKENNSSSFKPFHRVTHNIATCFLRDRGKQKKVQERSYRFIVT